jgi:hypothetical protein
MAYRLCVVQCVDKLIQCSKQACALKSVRLYKEESQKQLITYLALAAGGVDAWTLLDLVQVLREKL